MALGDEAWGRGRLIAERSGSVGPVRASQLVRYRLRLPTGEGCRSARSSSDSSTAPSPSSTPPSSTPRSSRSTSSTTLARSRSWCSWSTRPLPVVVGGRQQTAGVRRAPVGRARRQGCPPCSTCPCRVPRVSGALRGLGHRSAPRPAVQRRAHTRHFGIRSARASRHLPYRQSCRICRSTARGAVLRSVA